MPNGVEVRLEALCEVFQDDLDRQEDLLALCKLQGRAALDHDVELLEARTEAINVLITDAKASEKRRLHLATELVNALNLSPEQQSLSGLIEAAPDPWSLRMKEFQLRMREVIAETREIVRANNHVLRRSAKVVTEALEILTQCDAPARGQYDARGADADAQAQTPAFLDQRG